jgi:hypothetical protein
MGQTLPLAVIGCPRPDDRRSMFYSHAPSMFYVALSRVRSLDCVAFQFPPQRRFIENPNGQHYVEWTAEVNRLERIEAEMDQQNEH